MIQIQNILLEKIIQDTYFKISPPPGDELYQSVLSEGILVRPVIYFHNETYIVVCGHNRISALKAGGALEVEAELVSRDEINRSQMRECLRKKQEGSLSYMSVLLLYVRMQREGEDTSRLLQFFKIPPFFQKKELLESLLDNTLFCEYALRRRLSLKLIRWYCELGSEQKSAFNLVLSSNPRANIFKEALIIVDEIVRRGQKLQLEKKDARDEKKLVAKLRTLRYPLYTEIKERSDSLAASFSTKKRSLVFPEYLEGGYADIIIRIKAEDSNSDIQNRFKELSGHDFSDIISLLKG